MKKLIIFGTGDVSELAHYYFKNDSSYEIVGFVVDPEYHNNDTHCGLALVTFEEVTDKFPIETHDAFIAVGYRKLNAFRAMKVKEFEELGYSLASYVSTRASVLTEEAIGPNCFILEDNTIQPFVKIGKNVTMWSGNHIGHHSKIEDNCFITSHVVISGKCCVGSSSFIGVNSTIRDNVKIGKENMIGAGCLILNDTDDKAVYSGQISEKSRVPSNRLRGI